MHFLLIPYALLSLIFIVHFNTRREAGARAGLVLMASATLGLIFMAILMRPASGDSGRYYQYFLELGKMGLQDALAYRGTDPLYVLLNWSASVLGQSQWLLFGSTLMVYVGVFVVAVRRLVGLISTAILIMCYAAFPYFVAYAANGLRQGLSLVFLLMAYVGFKQEKRTAWLWLLLAPFWHSGAWLAVIIAIFHQLMVRFVRNERTRWKLVFLILFVAVTLSATGLNESVVSQFSGLVTLQKSQEIYFSDPNDVGYRAGFRPDFLLFSLLPLGVAWLLRRRASTFSYKGSGWWLSLYLSLNVIYHLFAFAPFADRFAAFSWFLMPLVIFLQIRETRNYKWMTIFVAVVVLVNIVMLQFYTGNFIQAPKGLG